MKVISIAQQKGGVGKTTIAVNLAGTFTEMGAQVHLFDADPQQSALAWAEPSRLPFKVHPAPFLASHPVRWAKSILGHNGDIALVDTSPGLGTLLDAVVDLSDLILLPCGPSSMELIALRQTVKAIGATMRDTGQEQPHLLIVPSRIDSTTPEGEQLKAELGSFGPRVGPALPFDMNFVRSFTSGETVSSSAPGSAADQSLKALAQHVISMLSWD